MEVVFQASIWSEFWIWLEFPHPPSEEERQYVQQLLESWYTLGMLGGFNASATPLQSAEVESLTDFIYPQITDRLPSLMHNMGELECKEVWGRCWFDLGTADLLALDILLNALDTLSRDYVPLKRVILGGDETVPA